MPTIERRTEDGIALVLLNRPEVRNAIDDAMRSELLGALDEIARDPAVRALVISGNGIGFCAGGDIRGMKQRLEAPAGEVAINGWRVVVPHAPYGGWRGSGLGTELGRPGLEAFCRWQHLRLLR